MMLEITYLLFGCVFRRRCAASYQKCQHDNNTNNHRHLCIDVMHYIPVRKAFGKLLIYVWK